MAIQTKISLFALSLSHVQFYFEDTSMYVQEQLHQKYFYSEISHCSVGHFCPSRRCWEDTLARCTCMATLGPLSNWCLGHNAGPAAPSHTAYDDDNGDWRCGIRLRFSWSVLRLLRPLSDTNTRLAATDPPLAAVATDAGVSEVTVFFFLFFWHATKPAEPVTASPDDCDGEQYGLCPHVDYFCRCCHVLRPRSAASTLSPIRGNLSCRNALWFYSSDSLAQSSTATIPSARVECTPSRLANRRIAAAAAENRRRSGRASSSSACGWKPIGGVVRPFVAVITSRLISSCDI